VNKVCISIEQRSFASLHAPSSYKATFRVARRMEHGESRQYPDYGENAPLKKRHAEEKT
jgi:hypothetical protein